MVLKTKPIKEPVLFLILPCFFIDFGQFLIVYSDFSQIGLVAGFPVESVDPIRFLKPYWEVTCTLLTSHNNN